MKILRKYLQIIISNCIALGMSNDVNGVFKFVNFTDNHININKQLSIQFNNTSTGNLTLPIRTFLDVDTSILEPSIHITTNVVKIDKLVI